MIEAANFAGLSQAGAPAMIVGSAINPTMAPARTRRPRKKRAGQYHHGDLRRALIDQALRTIDELGVEALTLRGVGEALGVSRTALYRHFSDKQTLLAVVGGEGFGMLRRTLTAAWE